MEKQNFILCQYSVKTKQLKKRSSELRISILLDDQITCSLWPPQTKHVCINCLVSYYIEGKLKKHHVVFFENDRCITKFLGNDSFQLQSKNLKLPLHFRYFADFQSYHSLKLEANEIAEKNGKIYHRKCFSSVYCIKADLAISK